MRINKEKILTACSKCGKPCEVAGSVRISISNPWHRYQGSGRPIQHRQHMRLCQRHFNRFDAELRRLIYNY